MQNKHKQVTVTENVYRENIVAILLQETSMQCTGSIES